MTSIIQQAKHYDTLNDSFGTNNPVSLDAVSHLSFTHLLYLWAHTSREATTWRALPHWPALTTSTHKPSENHPFPPVSQFPGLSAQPPSYSSTMEEQTQHQENPAQETAAPSDNTPATAPETVVPHHPPPDTSNGFGPSIQAAPMNQVLPEALQEVIPGGMPTGDLPPNMLPGMFQAAQMFMPELLQQQGAQVYDQSGVLQGLPVAAAPAISAGMHHFAKTGM